MTANKRHPILIVFLLALLIFLFALILKNNIVSFPNWEYSGEDTEKIMQVYSQKNNSNAETSVLV